MYVPYQPISKNPETSTFIPEELLAAQLQGIAKLPKSIVENWDEDIAKSLGFSVEKLWNNLSAEQIDSIGLITYNFKKNQSFIIADETGIGKGRILGGVCRWAFSQGLKVLFITERENLLSDFYRDLIDTEALELVKNPQILHSKSKVYNPDGEKVLTGTIKSVKDIEKNGVPADTNLVLTNYSQISSVQHKKTRLGFLSKYAENTVIILDESHNATGDSNTKSFLLELLQCTTKKIFSSATFIKDESQIELYQSCFKFDDDVMELFTKLMSEDRENTLRKVFCYELTKNLQFWRREHEPLSVGWNSIVVPRTAEQDLLVSTYSKIIRGMFTLAKKMNETPEFASLDVVSAWFSHGATVNRLTRNFLLLLKIPALAQEVQDTVANNRKSVIVIDSTFSSLINKVIEHQDLKNLAKVVIEREEDSENEDSESEVLDIKEGIYNLSFAAVLEYIIDETVGNLLKSRGATGDILNQYQDLVQETQAFQDLFISPIDQLHDLLAEKNIKMNEISGRIFKVENCNKIVKLKKLPKALIVKEFNDGLVDVIILTRAGASGLSLHASATFKDQRVRALFELEITNRPTYRMQFLGRVNRKNQVEEPLFYSIVTQLPFEQRILNMEKQKIAKMQSHVSGDDEKLEQENIHNFYTDYCNLAAEKFLRANPDFAKQMGVSLKNDAEPLYYIDGLLKRCIILTAPQQNALYDFLIYATECENFLRQNRNIGISSKMEKINTFWHMLDVPQQQEFKTKYKHIPSASVNQFNFAWVGLMTLATTYQVKFVLASKLQKEFELNFQKNNSILTHLSSVAQYLSYSGGYQRNYLEQSVLPNLQKINIGSLISMENKDGRIFGYIHDIKIPPVPNSKNFNELCMVQIKTVNPVNHPSIHYSNENYYISLKDLIEAKHLVIKNALIQWDLFNRYDAKYERTQRCLVGHPVYMEYLKTVYNIGNTVYKEIFGKKCMYVILPDTLSEQNILDMKKPMHKANDVMQALMDKQYTKLSTSWEPEESKIFAGLKVEHTVGGYHYYISDGVHKDTTFMDFPMKKCLKNFATRLNYSNGYFLYHVTYKSMRRVLFSFENKNVIWFGSN